MVDGFTLVELILVVTILGLVASIIGGILFTTFRSANKASSVTVVRQNGEQALSQMTKQIRAAKTFGGVAGNDGVFRTACTEPNASELQYRHIKITDFSDQEIVFSCTNTVPYTITANNASLISSADVETADDGNACYFMCVQSASNVPPKIDIFFSLERAGAGSSTDQQSRQTFTTTVVPRNAL